MIHQPEDRDPRGAVAVIGYSKSGKTSLLTEFVANYPGAVVWLNLERPPASGEEWRELALFQMANHFGLAESGRPVVRDHLLAEAQRQRVLVVIDDAHLLPDLNGIGFLDQVIAASKGRVAVLLAGVDEPAFVERMRDRGESQLGGFRALRSQNASRCCKIRLAICRRRSKWL